MMGNAAPLGFLSGQLVRAYNRRQRTFADNNGFKIPAIIEEFSKNRVLTEEPLEGRKPSHTADLAKRSKTLFSGRIARFSDEIGIFPAIVALRTPA